MCWSGEVLWVSCLHPDCFFFLSLPLGALHVEIPQVIQEQRESATTRSFLAPLHTRNVITAAAAAAVAAAPRG